MGYLFRCLKEDRIVVGMKARKKTDAIRELADVLEKAPEIPDFRQFVSALFQKESRFGTRVGDGVAIPHYRDDSVQEPVIALGISGEGVDWGEEEPVHVLVLVGWPNKHGEAYLKTVAELARILRVEPVRGQVLEAQSAADVLAVLKGESKTKEQVAC